MENENPPSSENPPGISPGISSSAAPELKGTGENPPKPGLDEKINRAGASAVAQHLAEQPARRGRGRPPTHGRFAKKLSVAGLDDGAASTPGAAAPGLVHPGGVPPGQLAFDEEAVKAVVEGLLGTVNDLAEAVMRSYALTHTRDKELAEQAGKLARMGDKSQVMVRAGALGCWRKYALDFHYVEETALLGGLALWLGGLGIQGRQLREKGKALRAPVAPAISP